MLDDKQGSLLRDVAKSAQLIDSVPFEYGFLTDTPKYVLSCIQLVMYWRDK